MTLKFYNDEWEQFIEHCGFTDDELQIVHFMRKGWYCADIAAEVNVSRRTVERRKNQIKQKITRYILKES